MTKLIAALLAGLFAIGATTMVYAGDDAKEKDKKEEKK